MDLEAALKQKLFVELLIEEGSLKGICLDELLVLGLVEEMLKLLKKYLTFIIFSQIDVVFKFF